MSNLQVKNVPDDLHGELRRRAELAGSSVRDYVLALLRRDLRVPPPEELRERIRALPPPAGGGESAVEAVRTVRRERAAELDARGVGGCDDVADG
jgi:plasmid stability protein